MSAASSRRLPDHNFPWTILKYSLREIAATLLHASREEIAKALNDGTLIEVDNDIEGKTKAEN